MSSTVPQGEGVSKMGLKALKGALELCSMLVIKCAERKIEKRLES